MASWDPTAGSDPAVLSFDQFELHLDSGELFRAGTPVKLQPQPAKVLEVLARRAGEVVSREEIQALVWGEDTFLDADASLNFCIKQIRRALDDPATSPRYIETIPRRGYRLLVPVEVRSRTPPALEPEPLPLLMPDEPVTSAVAPPIRPRRRILGVAATLVLVTLGLLVAMQRPTPPGIPETRAASASHIPPEAHERYLRAQYFFGREPEKARAELREAILISPRFAEAHAMLAWVERKSDLPPEKVLPELELTARRAVELGPDLGLAHLALGEVLLYYKLDWKGAEEELRRAVALDSHHAEAWHALALPLASLGRHGEAIAAARRACVLDPVAMLVNSDLAWFYYLDRQYDQAVRQAVSTLELKTTKERERTHRVLSTDGFYFRWALRVILYSSLQTGDRRAGIEAARQLMRELGHPEEAERVTSTEEFFRWERRQMIALSSSGKIHLYSFAHNAAAAGQPALALSYLEEACRRKWPQVLISAAADPIFDPLHGHPRFERFLDCVGVPADAPSRRR